MKFKSLYPLLFSVLLGVILLSCSTKIEEPEFRRISDFDVKQLGLQQGTISFNVYFYNPNSLEVTAKETVCDLYVDSTYIGKFTQPTPVEVGSKAEFHLPLTGVISLGTILQMNFKDLVEKEVLIRVTGTMRVGKGGIYFTRPITYQGKHRLNMDLIKNPAF